MDIHKNIPLSLLVTGLMAAPALGAPAPLPESTTATPIVELADIVAEPTAETGAFPAEMPADIARRYRRWNKGDRPDAGGMIALHDQIDAAMHAYLSDMLARSPFENLANAFPGDSLAPPQFPITATQAPAPEKVTFLGLATLPVPRPLSAQLNLPDGMGLVVNLVEKDSPAAAAGLQPDDVLQKFDDQLLINSEQFRVLVRSKKPGDSVTLSLLRGGKPLTAQVTLGQTDLANTESPSPFIPDIPDSVAPIPAIPGLRADTVSISRDDGAYAITLSINGPKRQLVVKETVTGKTLYDGPADSDAYWKKLPADIQQRISALLQKADALHKPDALHKAD